MLIRFNVSNYLSFDDVQSFTMIGGKTESHSDHMVSFDSIRLLKLSAIYGANASGKTNFIKAITAMKNLVSHNESMISDSYHRSKPGNKEKPSLFEVELELDGILYSYGFEIIISEKKIVDEWLHKLSLNEDSQMIFERNGDTVSHHFSGEDKSRIEIYAEDTVDQNNRLFLNVMGSRVRSKDVSLRIFAKVKKWFDDKLLILDTNVPFIPAHYLDDDYFEKLNRYMASFGTGINRMGYETKEGMENLLPKEITEEMKKQLMEKNEDHIGMRNQSFASFVDYRISLSGNGSLVFDEIVFKHKNGITFRSNEESDGTKKLFNLLANMIVDEDDLTFIIDELDARLHPQLTYHLVELFVKENIKKEKQLIFTTHESSLMDFQLLRRDEIWLTEKNNEGASSLYSLEDFNERNDRKVEKAYREGRYGGIPIFSTVFPYSEDQ